MSARTLTAAVEWDGSVGRMGDGNLGLGGLLGLRSSSFGYGVCFFDSLIVVNKCVDRRISLK